ncbi:MAG: ParB/RepB/Spo0J family partition protein [Bacillota bacterium]|jgi:ParB family chromosome partitioning protein
MVKKGLGKGLQALIPSGIPQVDDDFAEKLVNISIEDIVPNKNQPRRDFDPDKIEELAQSIKEHGILQPIVVRKLGNQKYEIIVGERRWRAAKLAGLKEISSFVREVSEQNVLELALIENIQRENLNPMEEAEGFQHLMGYYNCTQDELAVRLGKSRSYIANTMRLLNLEPTLQAYIREGLLSPGHARAILSINDYEKHISFAEEIINNKLSVRQAEEMAKELNFIQETINEEIDKTEKKQPNIYPEIKDFEGKLRSHLGTKVKIKLSKKGGRIEINFYNDDDLDRIMGALLTQDDQKNIY